MQGDGRAGSQGREHELHGVGRGVGAAIIHGFIGMPDMALGIGQSDAVRGGAALCVCAVNHSLLLHKTWATLSAPCNPCSHIRYRFKAVWPASTAAKAFAGFLASEKSNMPAVYRYLDSGRISTAEFRNDPISKKNRAIPERIRSLQAGLQMIHQTESGRADIEFDTWCSPKR